MDYRKFTTNLWRNAICGTRNSEGKAFYTFRRYLLVCNHNVGTLLRYGTVQIRQSRYSLGSSNCDGSRPKIPSNVPKCYAELMKQSWHPDPVKGPTAIELTNLL